VGFGVSGRGAAVQGSRRRTILRRSVLNVASEGDITIEMAVGHAAKHELDQRGDAASRRDRNGRTT